MSFTSVWFLSFITLIFILYHSIPLKYRYIVLFLANTAFILSWGIKSVVTISVIILVTYIGAITIRRSSKHRKITFSVFLTITIAVFLSCKYAMMFTGIWSIIGVSFYSLQAIGYLIDVYTNKTDPEKNIIRYSSFISFFPSVISGPIQRSTGLLKQIQNGTVFSYGLARSGALMMLFGYFEKILIADRIHILIDPIFADIYSRNGAVLLFGCFMYGIELYADFAGYSLIAIGTARLLGFDLEDNFRQPYFAVSIKDFWRRWHISLSTWLRDYIYIPLGGNRKGTIRKYINIMITFLISGIWHGNGFKFIAWGLLHGIYQVTGSIKDRILKNDDTSPSYISRIFRCVLTFLLVEFGWIFFRADSLKDVFIICRRIVCDLHLADTVFNQKYLAGYDMTRFIILLIEIVILFVLDLLRKKNNDMIKLLENKPIIIRWSIYLFLTIVVMIGALYNFGLDSSTFIYAQF